MICIAQRNHHECIRKKISPACCTRCYQHRLQLRNKEMELERQLRGVLLIFKLSFSLETGLDWLTLKEQTLSNFTSLMNISSVKVYNFLSLSSVIFYLFCFSKPVSSSLLYKTETKLYIMAFRVIIIWL